MAVYTCRSRFGSFPIVILVGYASPSSLSLPETILGPPSIHPVLILDAPGAAIQCLSGDVALISGQIGLESDAVCGTPDVFMAITIDGIPEPAAFGDPYIRYDLTAQSQATYGDVSIALPSGLAQLADFGVPPTGSFFVAGNLAQESTFGVPLVRIEFGSPVAIDSKFGNLPLVVPHWDLQSIARFGHTIVNRGVAKQISGGPFPIPPGRRQPTYYLEVLDESRLPVWKSRLHHIYARSLPPQKWPSRCWTVK